MREPGGVFELARVGDSGRQSIHPRLPKPSMHSDFEPLLPSDSSGLALVRTRACVDRALAKLASVEPLRGRVQVIEPLPEIRCDGAVLLEALYILLGALLEDPSVRPVVRSEVREAGPVLVVEGPLRSAASVFQVDAVLKRCRGSAWIEGGLTDEDHRVCLSPNTAAEPGLPRSPAR